MRLRNAVLTILLSTTTMTYAKTKEVVRTPAREAKATVCSGTAVKAAIAIFMLDAKDNDSNWTKNILPQSKLLEMNDEQEIWSVQFKDQTPYRITILPSKNAAGAASCQVIRLDLGNTGG